MSRTAGNPLPTAYGENALVGWLRSHPHVVERWMERPPVTAAGTGTGPFPGATAGFTAGASAGSAAQKQNASIHAGRRPIVNMAYASRSDLGKPVSHETMDALWAEGPATPGGSA